MAEIMTQKWYDDEEHSKRNCDVNYTQIDFLITETIIKKICLI